MMHKYQPDRSIGSTWHPLVHNNRRELAIQEDETSSIIIMLGEFYEQSGDRDFVEQLYETFTKPAANFLASYFDDETNLPHASYDLWEEKFLTTTYSTATTYEALRTAAKLAETFEYPDDAAHWRDAAARIEKAYRQLYDNETKAYRKGFLLQPGGEIQYDDTLDVSSLYGTLMFGPEQTLDELTATARKIEEVLLDHSPSGGAPRYDNDWYMRNKQNFKGNPWFVCTLWMAQYYIQMKQPEKAHELLRWTLKRTLPSGILSEQIDPEDSAPVGVAPLVWSHAEFINTVLDLAKV
jgi:glucoamylase